MGIWDRANEELKKHEGAGRLSTSFAKKDDAGMKNSKDFLAHYPREKNFRLRAEQKKDLLGHLHAAGHHAAASWTASGGNDKNAPQNWDLSEHHGEMAHKHLDAFTKKYEEYTKQPGISEDVDDRGDLDALSGGYDVKPGTPHPPDAVLKPKG